MGVHTHIAPTEILFAFNATRSAICALGRVINTHIANHINGTYVFVYIESVCGIVGMTN